MRLLHPRGLEVDVHRELVVRSVSSRSNRRLRDVASELVDGVSDGERATLIGPG
jgi:hypothetical protein